MFCTITFGREKELRYGPSLQYRVGRGQSRKTSPPRQSRIQTTFVPSPARLSFHIHTRRRLGRKEGSRKEGEKEGNGKQPGLLSSLPKLLRGADPNSNPFYTLPLADRPTSPPPAPEIPSFLGSSACHTHRSLPSSMPKESMAGGSHL